MTIVILYARKTTGVSGRQVRQQLTEHQPKLMIKYAILAICSAAVFTSGKAQNNVNTPASLPVIVKAGEVYNPFIEKQSRLYNGIEHVGYSFKIKGHAYFIGERNGNRHCGI